MNNPLLGGAMTVLPGKSAVTLTINGKEITVEVAPWTTLLDLLREYLNLTGTKKGCAITASAEAAPCWWTASA